MHSIELLELIKEFASANDLYVDDCQTTEYPGVEMAIAGLVHVDDEFFFFTVSLTNNDSDDSLFQLVGGSYKSCRVVENTVEALSQVYALALNRGLDG